MIFLDHERHETDGLRRLINFRIAIFHVKYHIFGMQMPNIRDFVNGRNIVILHSEIRVVHRLAADVDYFLCEDALHVALKNQRKGKSQR